MRIWTTLCTMPALAVGAMLAGQGRAEDHRNISAKAELRFPGPDKDAVCDVLQTIREGYLSANAPVDNVWVTGESSFTTKVWTPQASPELPPLHWDEFEAVYKDGHKRLSHQFVADQGPERGKALTSYSLFDASAFYLLKPGILAIFPSDRPEKRWLDLAFECEIFDAPYDGAKAWTPLPLFCEQYLARIREQAQYQAYFVERRRELRCRKSGSLWIIQDVGEGAAADPQDGNRYTTLIDTAKGFRVTEWRQESGHRGGDAFVRAVSKVDYREIAPKLFYPTHAELVSETRGDQADKEGRSGWVRRALNVKSVKFGDFAYDPKQFTLSSLPVESGTPVIDFRRSPAKQYKFGEAAVSEEAIKEGLVRRPAKPGRWDMRRLLVVCNIAVGAFMCAYLVVRLRRKA